MSQEAALQPAPPARKRVALHRVLVVMMLAVLLYAGFALYSGPGKLRAELGHFEWSAFAVACGLAFSNYVLRFLKWEFYLARLGIRNVGKLDSFLTFLSGFVLTISPGKVGEVFKSLVLFETHAVPMARTAPIVVAERITDLIGIIVLIVIGSLGFAGGLLPAAVGGGLVLALLVVISSRTLSMAIIGLVARLPGPFRRIGPKLEEAYESLTVLVKPVNLIWPTILSIGAWALECLALAMILHGLGEHVPITLSIFFYATSTLAGAVLPGGLGLTEAGLRQQMVDVGHVGATTGTAAMMLVRFATLWFAVAVGFAALFGLKRRYPGLLSSS